MNLGSSEEQLGRNLRSLHERTPSSANAAELQESVQELQAQRFEHEMQERALRETRAELEQSVRRYADLYDNLPLPYVTVTSSSQIVAANRAASEWLRRDECTLVGAFLSRFMDPYDRGRLAAHLEQAVQHQRASALELTLRREHAEPIPVQLALRPAALPPAGDAQIHIAITDISRLKQAQRVLEEMNQHQEEFNHSISHDLRGPIVTISTYAGIVLEEHATGLSDEGRGMLERIRFAAVRMEETLKQLLEYSRLSRADIVLEAVDVQQLVNDLLIEHRAAVQQSNAEVDVAKDLPPVIGARVILSQVLGNLLGNALKYAQPGQPPRVRIFGEVNGPNAIIKIADEGIGIDPKHHERIFRIFERLHSYAQYPGTGVGLAIARRAVERMNGRIWVESELGKGSCFCLELPKG